MLDQKTLPTRICRAVMLTLLASLFGVTSVIAQDMRTIYDGRAEIKTATPSNTEVQLIRQYALPKVRQYLRKKDVCQEAFEVIDVTSGSFTKPLAEQRAVLYRFCVTGHNFAYNGIVVIERGGIVAHIVYNGGEDHSIKTLEDINGNGLSELMLGDSSTNQGYTMSVVILIEVSLRGVKTFGIANVYEDNCGTLEQCKMVSYKLMVKQAPSPIFFRERYIKKRSGRWARSGTATRYVPEKNMGTYRLLN